MERLKNWQIIFLPSLLFIQLHKI